MATVSWKSGVGGDWNNDPSDWSTGIPPNAGDDVEIGVAGAQVLITSPINAIASLTIGSSASLGIDDPGVTQSITGNVSNSGELDIDFGIGAAAGGSNLAVGGTLTNSGAVSLGTARQAQPDTVTAAGFVNTGLLRLGSGSAGYATSVLDIAGPAGFGTAGVVTGHVLLYEGSLIDFTRGGITSIPQDGELRVLGADSFVAVGGATTSNSALTGLMSNAGAFSLGAGATVAVTGNLSNSGNIRVDFAVDGTGGGVLAVGGTLTNSGNLNIGAFNQTAPDTVTAAGLVNTGIIALGPRSGAASVLDIGAAAGFGTAGVVTGQVVLYEAALLGFARGAITTVANGARLALEGADALVAVGSATASNSALTSLRDIAGEFDLGLGATVAIDGNLANGGNLRVDFGLGGAGGSTLTVAGTLTNSGNLNIGTNAQTLSDTVSVAGLVNTGFIGVGPPAGAVSVLTVNGQGSPAVISNQGVIIGYGSNPAPIDFNYVNSTLVNYGTVIGSSGTAVALNAGGELVVIEPGSVLEGAIAGFAPGDTIDLAQVNANYVNFANGTLSVLYGSSVVETLVLPGTFSPQNFNLSPDGNGGTDLSIRYITGTYTTQVVIGARQPTTVEATGVVTVAQGNAVVNQAGSAATVSNFGTVAATGSGGSGVALTAGGTVTNSAYAGAYGLIAGYQAGVALAGGNGTILNASRIEGTGSAGVGVMLGSAASGAGARATYHERLSNYGTISGYTGVLAASGSDTLDNAGVITGYGGTAVMLGGGNDRLVIDPGAAFYGLADGGGGSSVLELAGPTAAMLGGRAAPSVGTLAGIGSSFVNFGTLVVDPGASWEASGDGSAYPFLNDGTIIVANGIVSTGEALALGTVGADPGQHGVVQVGAGGVVDFTGAAAGQTLVFTDAYGTLQLNDPGAFAARISGFQAGDVIDLVDVGANHFIYSKGKLKLTEAGHTVAVLSFAGHYTKADFQLSADGNGGTLVTFAAPAAASARYFFGSGPGQPEFWTVRG